MHARESLSVGPPRATSSINATDDPQRPFLCSAVGVFIRVDVPAPA